MTDFGIHFNFGMPFEYNVATYTLHLIGLYSVRYGKIVLIFNGRERRKFMGDQIHVTLKNGSWVVKQPGRDPWWRPPDGRSAR